MTAEILKPFGDYKVPGPNAEIVLLLEELLEMAKKGEIIGIAVATITKAHKVGNINLVGSASYAELLGAADILKDDIKEAWNEDQDG